MGGAEAAKEAASAGGGGGNGGGPALLEPDSAHNNTFDMDASHFFYRRCQELGALVIVSQHGVRGEDAARGVRHTGALGLDDRLAAARRPARVDRAA